jgi:hypothetical protein
VATALLAGDDPPTSDPADPARPADTTTGRGDTASVDTANPPPISATDSAKTDQVPRGIRPPGCLDTTAGANAPRVPGTNSQE